MPIVKRGELHMRTLILIAAIVLASATAQAGDQRSLSTGLTTNTPADAADAGARCGCGPTTTRPMCRGRMTHRATRRRRLRLRRRPPRRRPSRHAIRRKRHATPRGPPWSRARRRRQPCSGDTPRDMPTYRPRGHSPRIARFDGLAAAPRIMCEPAGPVVASSRSCTATGFIGKAVT